MVIDQYHQSNHLRKICFVHVHTKGVKNMKFSQNVYFDTPFYFPKTRLLSKVIELKYLLV